MKSDNLDQLRKKAVEMRLKKNTLDEIHAETGLSHPTIIASYKKFLAGGWGAVSAEKRGRPPGVKGLKRVSMTDAFAELLKYPSPYDAEVESDALFWKPQLVQAWLKSQYKETLSLKSVQRYLKELGLVNPARVTVRRDEVLKKSALPKPAIFISGMRRIVIGGVPFYQLYLSDLRNSCKWVNYTTKPDVEDLLDFYKLAIQSSAEPFVLLSRYPFLENDVRYQTWCEENSKDIEVIPYDQLDIMNENRYMAAEDGSDKSKGLFPKSSLPGGNMHLTHLQRLESESIQIMREVVAAAENPAMLYSIGKDSAVMLHIAMKAFYPALPPFPLLHVDTTWKFQDMYAFRDKVVKGLGLELISYTNPEGLEKGINPFTHGSAIHTDIMKTEALKQALDKYGFDAALGGARRDEERSRAKERVFSFRTNDHRWDPKNQRPELWKQYNARTHKGESIRVFPLSNWTELDIWQYIYMENIPIVPLYYSAERPVVERDGTLIMVDDERMPLQQGEIPMMKSVRFRTLGCYPLTGAVESTATSLPEIIQEMLLSSSSERQGRVIDHDSTASMEKKKQEGYF